jgi:hypothetical protein
MEKKGLKLTPEKHIPRLSLPLLAWQVTYASLCWESGIVFMKAAHSGYIPSAR